MKDACLIEKNERGYMKITINRPEKRNAINLEVMELIDGALDMAAQDESVKVVILTGTGKDAFCSGGDLSVFHKLRTEEDSFAMLSKMGGILYKLAVLPKPTIAVLNGSAVGGGCEIASACDFRLAREGIRIGFVQGTLGITTGWGGASLLYEKLPAGAAMELLLGAEIHSAEGAKEKGFIDHVIMNTESESTAFISSFLEKELGVLSAYKELLIAKWKQSGLKERMEQESRQCAKLWATDAHHHAVDRSIS
ncbi:enoyl-CoA hydratase/isomerase family protein [Peribacillus psychrosaccharolyticus]|uniref:enoyl-CoA hydratase/isomerase family protein n=1 Tax=Peribacillus psychrosaccharolyticus TaxID=1407 RepID=UPI003D288D3D